MDQTYRQWNTLFHQIITKITKISQSIFNHFFLKPTFLTLKLYHLHLMNMIYVKNILTYAWNYVLCISYWIIQYGRPSKQTRRATRACKYISQTWRAVSSLIFFRISYNTFNLLTDRLTQWFLVLDWKTRKLMPCQQNANDIKNT